MTDTLILDSDILIDVSRNYAPTVSFVSELEKQYLLAISSVSEMELIIGCQNKQELTRVQNFLRRFQILHLSEPISERTIDLLNTYKLSHGLLIADAMIAATVIIHNKELVTRNQRDFRFISGLKLRDIQ